MEANTHTQAVADNATKVEAARKLLAEVKRQSFEGAALESANNRVAGIIEAADIVNENRPEGSPEFTITYGFDTEEDFPADTHALTIVAKTVRADGQDTNVGVIVGAHPRVDQFLADEAGAKFAQEAIEKKLQGAIVSAVKRQEKDNTLLIPFEIADFIKARKLDESGFKDIAGDVVKKLKEKGGDKLKNLNPRSLRACCSSKQQAESLYPLIPNEQWEKVIERMTAITEKRGQDTAIYAHWLATREQTVQDMASGLDVDALNDFLDDDDEVENEAEVPTEA